MAQKRRYWKEVNIRRNRKFCQENVGIAAKNSVFSETEIASNSINLGENISERQNSIILRGNEMRVNGTILRENASNRENSVILRENKIRPNGTVLREYWKKLKHNTNMSKYEKPAKRCHLTGMFEIVEIWYWMPKNRKPSKTCKFVRKKVVHRRALNKYFFDFRKNSKSILGEATVINWVAQGGRVSSATMRRGCGEAKVGETFGRISSAVPSRFWRPLLTTVSLVGITLLPRGGGVILAAGLVKWKCSGRK